MRLTYLHCKRQTICLIFTVKIFSKQHLGMTVVIVYIHFIRDALWLFQIRCEVSGHISRSLMGINTNVQTNFIYTG
jgi:hypothetical protein